MGESSFVCDVETKVLGKSEHAPKGWKLASLFETGDSQVEEQDEEVCGNNSQKTFEIKFSIGNGQLSGELAEELSPDKKSAKHKEEVYSCPAEAASIFREVRRKTGHDRVVIDKDDDDGQRPEMVQAGKTIYRCAGLQGKKRSRMMNKMLPVR
jgi:hypothetical protein